MVSVETLTKTFGTIAAVTDFTVDVRQGELLVLLGPSGCGKTTLIRLIAGLEIPDSGSIFAGDVEWTHLPPQKRNAAMVFQHFALYPHRTVQGNIEYPLRLRGVATADRKKRVESIASLLGISTLLDRKPKQLSGGEAQRVALARALVREPSCFLMDEPLSNLDAQLRIRARAEIKRIQRKLGVPTIHVTHDQEEAVALGDRIAVMNKGQLVQIGTPEELFQRPTSTFVAGFLGRPPMNLISGNTVNLSGCGFAVRLEVGEDEPVVLPGFRVAGLSDGQKVRVGFRPDHVQLGDNKAPDENGELMLPARVDMVEGLEPDFIAHCQTPVGALLVRTRIRPTVGSTNVLLQAAKAHLFDAETGNRVD